MSCSLSTGRTSKRTRFSGQIVRLTSCIQKIRKYLKSSTKITCLVDPPWLCIDGGTCPPKVIHTKKQNINFQTRRNYKETWNRSSWNHMIDLSALRLKGKYAMICICWNRAEPSRLVVLCLLYRTKRKSDFSLAIKAGLTKWGQQATEVELLP